MPRVAASNGVRPEIRALAVIKLNKPVTPEAINEQVGTGNYAAKYVSFLNTRYGFEIEAKKEDRKVVAYVLRKEPKTSKLGDQTLTPKELRELAVKGPKPKAPKEQVEKVAKAKGARKVNKKFNEMPANKKGAAAKKAAGVRDATGRFVKTGNDLLADKLLAELGMQNAGEVGNFAVDPGFDNFDLSDLRF